MSLLSDITDGFLARRLRQTSELGAKLDSQRWHALTSLCRNANLYATKICTNRCYRININKDRYRYIACHPSIRRLPS